MAGHRDSRTRIYATLPSALKAPPHASPGQRPGFWERPITVRPERAQGSPLRPFRAEEVPQTRSRGVAPGWHAPRPWRVNVAEFSNRENCHEEIPELGSSSFRLFRIVWNQFIRKAT